MNSTNSANKPLKSELRKQLERMVEEARRVAVAGAREALEALTVGQGKRGDHVQDDEKIELRNRLRAHGRFLGDRRNSQSGEQKIDRLIEECAYMHWHRLLFARFLLENHLLIFPETGTAIAFEELEEIADESDLDPWELAGQYAQLQLPAIFRADNPGLDLELSNEFTVGLRELLEAPVGRSKKGLPVEVFTASDSLGWVYQFWQNEENERANKSEDKIDSSTLPAVTQFFTEDYMVMFLLHNTLGAWHAGKVLSANPDLAANASTEDELRDAVALSEAGGYEFEYLRFVRGQDVTSGGEDKSDQPWRPMGGTFDGWPNVAAELRVLDPCCGSGHFLVAALELLVRLRMHEEGLSLQGAIDAVLSDNLFGLELDKRCTQIAVFNLAMAAWKLDDHTHRELPSMTIAHVGQSIGATKDQWMALLREAGDEIDDGMGFFWGQLYDMFSQAATLGSLINPRRFLGSHQLSDVQMKQLVQLLESAVESDRAVETETIELQLAARGFTEATKLLSENYDLILTNVPFLGNKKQAKVLRNHIETSYPAGKQDLATAMLERSFEYSSSQGVVAAVSPQNWLFLSSYSRLRKNLLEQHECRFAARLGAGAFDTISGEVVSVALNCWRRCEASDAHMMFGLDVGDEKNSERKCNALLSDVPVLLSQANQIKNPDSRITFLPISSAALLATKVITPQGIKTGDDEKWRRYFWEITTAGDEEWPFYQSSVSDTCLWGGRSYVIDWRTEGEGMVRPRLGNEAIGKMGIAVSTVGSLSATVFTGERYDSSVGAVVPSDSSLLTALWCFCSNPVYEKAVRSIDQKVAVTSDTLAKVPFEETRWANVANNDFPNGLPSPESDSPTQWIFHGWPGRCQSPLHVALAKLLGYQWPAEAGLDLELSDDARQLTTLSGSLGQFLDDDGIVCIPPIRGEDPAADRLSALLHACDVSTDENLDEWLRNRFFKEHCELFDHRPFIWHIWDGRKQDGFHALVNYHKLAGPRGHKVLERLTYSYLGDWIERCEDEVKREVSGGDARLLAARQLHEQLEKILKGEPPYDIFVRWKPIHEQPIGWNPNINDGVRINIRPFMQETIEGGQKGAGILRVKPKRTAWGKDRGKEPKRPIEEYPWFWTWDQDAEDFTGGDKFDGLRWNGCHYTNAFKQAARDSQSEDLQ